MSEKVSGEVTLLRPTDTGYVVSVSVTTESAGDFEVEFETYEANPNQAIETARKALYEIGAAMAKTFDSIGSLK